MYKVYVCCAMQFSFSRPIFIVINRFVLLLLLLFIYYLKTEFIFADIMKYFYRIMLTCQCIVDPFTSHFYIVKLGFTGVYIILLFLL